MRHTGHHRVACDHGLLCFESIRAPKGSDIGHLRRLALLELDLRASFVPQWRRRHQCRYVARDSEHRRGKDDDCLPFAEDAPIVTQCDVKLRHGLLPRSPQILLHLIDDGLLGSEVLEGRRRSGCFLRSRYGR